ncbi:MAG: arginine repressor [Prevotella sp.]|nr:arginine repressor [Prevotella sp.]
MSTRVERIAAIKSIITTHELSSQEEVLQALAREGFVFTQGTLSRDMKHLKVAKAANANGKYVYVLPTETMYKRVHRAHSPEVVTPTGFVSIDFSGNMGVIHTRPGHASSIAYNIDASKIEDILGTIAGDDTIFIVIRNGVSEEEIIDELTVAIPDIKEKK